MILSLEQERRVVKCHKEAFGSTQGRNCNLENCLLSRGHLFPLLVAGPSLSCVRVKGSPADLGAQEVEVLLEEDGCGPSEPLVGLRHR